MGDDDALLRACRAGDDRAWRALVDRYVRLVHAIPLRFGLPAEDAEDVVQLTFAALMSSLDRITEPHRLGAWLSTVARRQTFRHLDRRRRDAAVAAREAADVATDRDAERRVEEIEWLHQGLAGMDERCRRLLVALYFSGPPRPYHQIAAELAMPVGSIGPTRARCLDKLRTRLEQLQDP